MRGRAARREITPAEELQIEQVYSRGLGDHFLHGTNHQRVVEGRAPRHRGVLIGRVTKVVSDAAVIDASDAHQIAPLKPGDGVVFDAAAGQSDRTPRKAAEYTPSPNNATEPHRSVRQSGSGLRAHPSRRPHLAHT